MSIEIIFLKKSLLYKWMQYSFGRSSGIMKILVTSDDTGAVKEVICSRGTDTSKQDARQPKSIKNICSEPGASVRTRILHMVNFKSTFLVTSRLGGSVTIYDLNHEEYELIHTYQLPISNEDKPISLIELEEFDVVVVAFESGKVFFINLNNGLFDLDPIEIELPGKKGISAFINNPHEAGIFACGGKENDARVIRLFKGEISKEIFESGNKQEFFKAEVLFTARNVKNDHLDLRPPIWISKIRFFEEKPKDGYKFVTSTRYGQIRIYDTTHGKRPIHDFKVCEKPIVTLNFADSEEEIIISDTHNLVAKYSLTQIDSKAFKTLSASAGEIIKPVTKLMGKFAAGGNTGAIVGVDIFDQIISTGGLDRYLRVYDINSRDIFAKVYLGVQVSDVLMLDSEDEEEEEDESEMGDKRRKNLEKRRRKALEEENESDEEALWNQLEENNKTKIEKKKRRI